MRIYDLDNLACRNGTNAISSEDEIDEAYEIVRNSEKLFFTKEIVDGPNYEDFMLESSGRITALNLYGGDTLTLSQQPDLYEYRVFKRNK